MERDVQSHRAYLERVEKRLGGGEASRIENAIRRPYQTRIEQLRASESGFEIVLVPVVTLEGAISFSATSFDTGLRPKDPVSVVLYGQAHLDSVYQLMTLRGCGATCGRTLYQDETGTPDASGKAECDSATQWVLAGDADAELAWEPNTKGMMRMADRCTTGSRVHVRMFNGGENPLYGRWMVATPHQEVWSSGRHVVESWNRAQEIFAGYWLDEPDAIGQPTLGTPEREWESINLGTAQAYQDIPFDGKALLIEVHTSSLASR
jgi:hypothetical protein